MVFILLNILSLSAIPVWFKIIVLAQTKFHVSCKKVLLWKTSVQTFESSVSTFPGNALEMTASSAVIS